MNLQIVAGWSSGLVAIVLICLGMNIVFAARREMWRYRRRELMPGQDHPNVHAVDFLMTQAMSIGRIMALLKMLRLLTVLLWISISICAVAWWYQ